MARINGKQKRIKLGRYPAKSLQDARRDASKIRDDIDRGIDPTKMAEPDPGGKTFGSVAEDYIRLECPRLSCGTDVESAIRRRLLPYWENRVIGELRRADATERIDAVMDEGKPSAANSLYSLIGRIGHWATARGDLDASPFTKMKPPAEKTERSRVLSPDEIRALWKAWDEQGYPFGDLQKILLLTLQRRNEVAGLRPSEIDFDTATWSIPDFRTKNGLAMLVPLSPMALDILEGLPEYEADGYMFSTTGGDRPVSGFSRAKKWVDKVSNADDWVWHDLRRTGRTALSRLKVPEVVCERALNHVEGNSLKRTYNHHELQDEKREALNLWAQELARILEHDGADLPG